LAYWCMVGLLKGVSNSRHWSDLGMLHYYTPNMKLLFLDMKILKRLVQSRKNARATLEAIEKHGLSVEQFFVKFFLTFTAGALPPETTMRIWDCFFLEGVKVIFRLIVVLLERHKDEFVGAGDIEGIMSIWKRITESLFNHQALIEESLRITSSEFKRKKIHTLERQRLSGGIMRTKSGICGAASSASP